jgi:hypothetical protein
MKWYVMYSLQHMLTILHLGKHHVRELLYIERHLLCEGLAQRAREREKEKERR